MPILGALIIVLIVVIPMLPSVLLTVLGAMWLKRNRKFLYYNYCFAAVGNIVLLLTFLLTYSVMTRGQKREDLWVLLALVPLGLIFSGSAYLLGYIGYKLTGTSSEDVKTLPWYPLCVSIVSICLYPLLMVISLMRSSGQ